MQLNLISPFKTKSDLNNYYFDLASCISVRRAIRRVVRQPIVSQVLVMRRRTTRDLSTYNILLLPQIHIVPLFNILRKNEKDRFHRILFMSNLLISEQPCMDVLNC